MNDFMPEIISEPISNSRRMPKPMPNPETMPVFAPMPTRMPEPMFKPAPAPMPAPMFEFAPAPMPEPRKMPEPAPERKSAYEPKPEAADLSGEHDAMFTLCARYMMCMNSLVISVVDGLPDVQICSRRAAKNNSEFMDYIKPHADRENSKNIAELLNQNLVYTVQMAQAIKGGNQKVVAEAWGRLTQNSDHMIAAVCKAVPHFDCAKLKNYHFKFLEMLKEEIMFKVNKRM